MGGPAQRLRANLSLSWRWFSYWRKRYVWLRLLILLLVFAQPIYESRKPLIRELVVIAIKGIESAKCGPYFETRAIQHQEKKRLQRALLARFDANRDGRLSAGEARSLKEQTGLSREQVEGRALDVGLDPLVDASHAVGLLSRTWTANDFRREALATALADHQREHEALWEEIGPDLEMRYPTARDYLRWETWRHGLASFLDVLRYRFGLRFLPGPRLYEENERWLSSRPLWQYAADALSLVMVVLAVVLSVHRYGKGKELERRFLEEPSLAEAPCPVCSTPTHDYGALAQHRGSRAWTAAAVAGLAATTLWLFVSASCKAIERVGVTDRDLMCSLTRPFESYWVRVISLVAIMAAAGIVRWRLWPREVHVAHRRPWVRTLGFTLSVVLVLGLLFSIGLASVRTWCPSERVVVIAGSERERFHPKRQGARGRAQATPPESSAPAATPSPTHTPSAQRGVRGAETRVQPERRTRRREQTTRERRGRRGRAPSSRATRD